MVKFSGFLIFLGLIVLITFSCSFWIGEDWKWGMVNSEKIGHLGDIVGGMVGSLWALASVMLFYAAFQKQREALENQKVATNALKDSIQMQKEELKLNRAELEETRKVFAQQEETLRLQRFENSFYNLINLLNSIIQNIDIKEVTKLERGTPTSHPIKGKPTRRDKVEKVIDIHKGRDCFQFIYTEMERKLSQERDSSLTIHQIKKVYFSYESDLFPYYQLLEQIIILLEKKEKNQNLFYINVLKSQITRVEKLLIEKFLDAEILNEKFKKLSF